MMALGAAMAAGATAAMAQTPTAGMTSGADSQGAIALRGGLSMLTVDGVNVTIQNGAQGLVVVDTGPATAASQLLGQIRQLSGRPIRFLIDTNADAQVIGGNAVVAAAGQSLATTDTFDAIEVNGNTSKVSLPGQGATAVVIARQTVLTQMLSEPGANYASAALPSDTFTRKQFNFFLNGTPISVVSLPAGHSGSDAAVRFDRPDVVVTGAVFDQTRFPVIDVANGGGIQGEIDALDEISNTLSYAHVPVLENSGATLIVPIRGPVSDEDDLVTYRDMVSTVRDRIAYYIAQGKTLAQVQGLNPARGYKSRYGTESGSWTTDDFIKAVYQSLKSGAAHHGRPAA
jgi:glyoxylase-like metal-dependent hydrolase (beta-lactamase superfamily II)